MPLPSTSGFPKPSSAEKEKMALYIHVNKIGTNDNNSDLSTKALCAKLFRKQSRCGDGDRVSSKVHARAHLISFFILEVIIEG